MNMHVAVPGKPQDSRVRNLRSQERKRQKTLKTLAVLRKEAADEITRLIAFLDSTDPYASTELEAAVDDGPCDDDELEPSLTGVSGDDMRRFAVGHQHQFDHEGDDSDDEPSLAAPENHPSRWGYGVSYEASQESWARGRCDELEGDGCADDREGDELLHGGEAVHEDDEPSLGWTSDEAGSGRYRGVYGMPDLERAVL